jgi:hypothetical protein
MMVEAPAPSVDYDGYRRVIADEVTRPPSEWTFKGNPAYRQILEHVTPEQGHQFIACARAEFPELWTALTVLVPQIAMANDDLGQPVRSRFDELVLECSPSNLRYLWHALQTWQHIDALGQPQVHLVELGGGYGGLASYVYGLADLFMTKLASYTIVDLPEVAALQLRYTATLGLPVRTVNGLDPTDLGAVFEPADGVQRFFVSAYGFAEFSRPLKDWYVEHLVRHCAHGFLVWNYHPYWQNDVYTFVDGTVRIVPERPLIDPLNSFVSF